MVIEAGNLIANRYRVLRVLGEGGAGVVYHVEDTGVTFQRRELALKVLDERYYDNKEVLSRFQNELLITEQFSHENIVRAGSFEHVDGLYFITMEYVKGQNVKELLEKSQGGLPLQYALKILYRVADALEYAHKKGIIHRDIKPDNILISENGDIKVSDFGIARPLENYQALTIQDDFVGTRTYMSPEQLRSSQEIDYRTDIYSLGIVAFELLTGHPPFEAESEFVISNMHCKSPIPAISKDNPKAPMWLQSFVEKCSAKDPSKRFQSMGDIKKLLLLHLDRDNKKGPLDSENDAADTPLSAWLLHTKLYISRRSNFLKKFLIAALLGYLNFYFQFPMKNVFYSGELGYSLEPQAFDYWFPLRERLIPSSPPEKTTIVYIDSESYSSLNANLLKPFPRPYLSAALHRIASMGPKKVIIDLVVLDNSSGHESDEAREKARHEADELADALAASPTYLARTRITKAEHSNLKREIFSADGLRSDKKFIKAAEGEFYANLLASRGVIRHFYHGAHDWYISTPMATILYGSSTSQEKAPHIGEYINYYSDTNSINATSLYLILNEEVPEHLIHDKYVFLGRKPDPSSDKDTFYTPFGTRIPGVEIHATILANILHQEWIKRLRPEVEKFLVLALTITLCFIIISVEPGLGLIIAFSGCILSYIISFILFLNELYVPGLITLPFIILATYLVVHVALLQRIYHFLENIGFERRLK